MTSRLGPRLARTRRSKTGMAKSTKRVLRVVMAIVLELRASAEKGDEVIATAACAVDIV